MVNMPDETKIKCTLITACALVCVCEREVRRIYQEEMIFLDCNLVTTTCYCLMNYREKAIKTPNSFMKQVQYSMKSELVKGHVKSYKPF